MDLISKTVCIISLVSVYFAYRKVIHKGTNRVKVKLVEKIVKCIQCCTLKFVTMRSNYVWTDRNDKSPLSRRFFDKVFIVDPMNASLNSSLKASERVAVDLAMITRGSVSMDVTHEMRNMLGSFDDPFMGDNGQITVDIDDVAPGMAGAFGGDLWYLDVTYRGHSDEKKKIESQKYSVRYRAKWEEFVTFPPYSINEKPSRGLGSKKVISAECLDGTDVAYLAKQYAGLKTNFYDDCPDEVLKNHMSMEAKVTLSKGDSRTVTMRS